MNGTTRSAQPAGSASASRGAVTITESGTAWGAASGAEALAYDALRPTLAPTVIHLTTSLTTP
jgi:hypothetical protein